MLKTSLLLGASALSACSGPTADGKGTQEAAQPTAAASAQPIATAPVATESATSAATAPAATSAPVASATTAPSATPSASATAAAEPLELTIAPRALEIDKAKGKVVFDRDGGRQTNRYRKYEFTYDQFVAVVGKGNLAKNLKLQVEVLSKDSGSSPGDPKGAKPAGGFLFETYTCKALKLLSAD